MTDSTLCLQPSGEWAIAAPGREPVAGEVFLLEVQGERQLMRVRMECKEGAGTQTSITRRRAELRNGLRAGFFDR